MSNVRVSGVSVSAQQRRVEHGARVGSALTGKRHPADSSVRIGVVPHRALRQLVDRSLHHVAVSAV